jgi:hypothetical protein
MALPNATKNIANTIVTVAIAQDVAAPYHARNQKSRSTNSAAKMVTFQVILVLPEGERPWMGEAIFGFNVRPLFLGRWALHRSVMGRA